MSLTERFSKIEIPLARAALFNLGLGKAGAGPFGDSPFTAILPLLLLPDITWQGFLAPTLEGQYIIKTSLSLLRPWWLRPTPKTSSYNSW